MFCHCMQNPYVLSATPCGSRSGLAIPVVANLVAMALGTETDGSILYLASFNSVVGIKPIFVRLNVNAQDKTSFRVILRTSQEWAFSREVGIYIARVIWYRQLSFRYLFGGDCE
ncbi:putative amidase [Quercus suber]|uniref:Amidase n=1 Tax=Quercus suber TaxID=58331 RepID=A0AAW0LBG4_QUESU